jgi:hypothetical protein
LAKKQNIIAIYSLSACGAVFARVFGVLLLALVVIKQFEFFSSKLNFLFIILEIEIFEILHFLAIFVRALKIPLGFKGEQKKLPKTKQTKHTHTPSPVT